MSVGRGRRGRQSGGGREKGGSERLNNTDADADSSDACRWIVVEVEGGVEGIGKTGVVGMVGQDWSSCGGW